MKFLDIFNPIEKGSHGLTDEAIYGSIGNSNIMIPLYGGNSQHSYTERYIAKQTMTVDGTEAKVFSGEGVVISLDGSAGCMTYKSGELFSLNHHAGFITLKESEKGKVNLQFFSLFMQNHYKSMSVSDGSKTLSLSKIYSDDFSLPSKETQDMVIEVIKPLIPKIELLYKIEEKITDVTQKQLSINYTKFQAKNINIAQCIDYLSGNTGLTEEFLYNNIELKGDRYKILSSATQEENILGEIPMCKVNGKDLKVFTEHKEGLLVIRKGKAGKTVYLKPGLYTLNDDAYILFVKENCPYQIHLKWLSIQYREDFLSYASSSDNGTWNMTGFFNHVVIDIPNYDEQLNIVRLYEKAEILKSKINRITDKLSILLNKEIC